MNLQKETCPPDTYGSADILKLVFDSLDSADTLLRVRIIWTLMILAWLPRALLAVPAGSLLCVGSDHITLDCHEKSEHDHPCEPERDSAPQEACVDVVSFVTSAPAKVSYQLFDAELIALLPPPSQLVLCSAFFAVPRGGDDPPGFAARAFASSISLRR